MDKLLKFRQYIDGEFYYWGYGVADDPDEFVPPKDPRVPSEQYIGLADKYGIAVYENDIVRKWLNVTNKSGGNPGPIRKIVERVSGSQYQGWNITKGHSYIAWQIVGNIHESPEAIALKQTA